MSDYYNVIYSGHGGPFRYSDTPEALPLPAAQSAAQAWIEIADTMGGQALVVDRRTGRAMDPYTLADAGSADILTRIWTP